MSLLKLLSVGRSFAGAVHEPGRYKMSSEYRLPQFGSSNSDGRSDCSATQGAPEAKPVAAYPLNFFERLLDRFCQRRPTQTPFEARGSGTFHTPEKVRSETFQRRPRAPLSSKPRLGALLGRAPSRPAEQRLQQIELELDQVRVVRNDLSEADLQVVARTGATRSRSAAKEDSQPASPPAADSRLTWNRMTARLFVAGRSRLE